MANLYDPMATSVADWNELPSFGNTDFGANWDFFGGNQDFDFEGGNGHGDGTVSPHVLQLQPGDTSSSISPPSSDTIPSIYSPIDSQPQRDQLSHLTDTSYLILPGVSRQQVPQSPSPPSLSHLAEIYRTRELSSSLRDSIAKNESKWTLEEDALLIYLHCSGMKWPDISKRMLGRSARSCRLRYEDFLKDATYNSNGSIYSRMHDIHENIAASQLTVDELLSPTTPALVYGLDNVADLPTQEQNPLPRSDYLAPKLPQKKPRGKSGSCHKASSAGSNARLNLPKAAQALLQNLLHRNPYPNKVEKERLAIKTGLTTKQIGTWLNNKRSRAQGKLKSIMHTPSTHFDHQDTSISTQHCDNPMQRFLTTPPEDDPAPIAVVAAAAQQVEVEYRKRKVDESEGLPLDMDGRYPCLDPVNANLSSSYLSNDADYPDNSLVFSRPASNRGYDSVSMSGISSGTSIGSADSQVSHASWAGRRGRKKIRTNVQYPKSRQGNLIFQCTWCNKGFRRADAWKRHEECEHSPQFEWVCMPNGPTEVTASGERFCVFCGPCSIVHSQDQHSSKECFAKKQEERSFTRKDGLQQHLKQKHGLEGFPVLDHWRRPISSADNKETSCGFCEFEPPNWDSRAKHIAQHFRDGYGMRSWVDPELWKGKSSSKEAVRQIRDIVLQDRSPGVSVKDWAFLPTS